MVLEFIYIYIAINIFQDFCICEQFNILNSSKIVNFMFEMDDIYTVGITKHVAVYFVV